MYLYVMCSCNAAKPNIFNLMVFRWKDTEGKIAKFRLRPQIYHRWQDIGNLVLPLAKLEALRREKDAEQGCNEVLRHWLQHPPPRYPATWEGLYELLDDCNLGEVATQLRHAVQSAVV